MSQQVCHDYFSLWQLADASRETEMFNTSACVPNQVKLAFFLILLLTYAGFLIFICYLLYKHHRGLKCVIYLLCLVTCLGQIMSLAIFMAGVDSGWKFLAFTVPAISTRSCVLVFVHRWYGFLNSSAPLLSDINMAQFRLIYLMMLIMNIVVNIFSIGICIAIGPIITYNEPAWLNFFYMMNMMSSAIAAGMICVIYLYIGGKLLHIFSLKSDMVANPEVEALDAKIRVVVGTGKVMLPMQLVLFVTPLVWYVVAANHDIRGIFYFHFIVMSSFIFCSLCNYLHTVTYNSSAYGSSDSYSASTSQLSSAKA